MRVEDWPELVGWAASAAVFSWLAIGLLIYEGRVPTRPAWLVCFLAGAVAAFAQMARLSTGEPWKPLSGALAVLALGIFPSALAHATFVWAWGGRRLSRRLLFSCVACYIPSGFAPVAAFMASLHGYAELDTLRNVYGIWVLVALAACAFAALYSSLRAPEDTVPGWREARRDFGVACVAAVVAGAVSYGFLGIFWVRAGPWVAPWVLTVLGAVAMVFFFRLNAATRNFRRTGSVVLAASAAFATAGLSGATIEWIGLEGPFGSVLLSLLIVAVYWVVWRVSGRLLRALPPGPVRLAGGLRMVASTIESEASTDVAGLCALTARALSNAGVEAASVCARPPGGGEPSCSHGRRQKGPSAEDILKAASDVGDDRWSGKLGRFVFPVRTRRGLSGALAVLTGGPLGEEERSIRRVARALGMALEAGTEADRRVTSERRLAQSELASVVGRLSRALETEVKKPLDSIERLVSLVRESGEEGGVDSDLAAVEAEAKRLKEVLENLAATEARESDLFDPRQMVEGLVEVYSKEASSHGVKFASELHDLSTLAGGDERIVRRAIVSVMEDLLVLAGEGGTLSLKLFQDGAPMGVVPPVGMELGAEPAEGEHIDPRKFAGSASVASSIQAISGQGGSVEVKPWGRAGAGAVFRIRGGVD